MKRAIPAAGAALLMLAACRPDAPAMPDVPRATVLTAEGDHQPSSSFSPDGRRVAYWAAGATGWELRVAQADLTGAKVLATAQDYADPIIWSPDGTRIVYSSNAASFMDVWMVSADGGAPTRLTTAAGSEFPVHWHPRGDRVSVLATEQGGTFRTRVVLPGSAASSPMLPETRAFLGFWSPDAAMIAYQISVGSNSTLWVADSAGGNVRQLTTEGLEVFDQNSTPWSPDGKEVAYTSRRTGTGDVWAIAVKDGTARQVTRDVRDDYAPTWSADGKWIAFVSERGRQTDVWVTPAAGGDDRRVTDDVAREDHLAWIGTSSRLAFETGRTRRVLVRIDAADGSERQVTPDTVEVNAFDISPDGRTLVFGAALGGGVSEVRTIALEDGATRTIAPGPSANADPYFSPDGKHVLFFSNRSGSPDAWVIDPAGGTPRQLTNWPSEETDAEWSADSKWVYFLSGRTGGSFYDLYRVSVDGGEPQQLTRSGSVQNIEPARGGDRIYVTELGKRAGQFVLNQLLPDGTVRTLWDRTNIQGLSHRRISPTGDSLAVQIEQPGGGFGSAILSAITGATTPILGKQETAGPWAPDGQHLLYYFGSPAADLGVLDLRTGVTRRLTTTAANEGSAVWTPDSKAIVVLRAAPRRRIAVVDVSALLGPGGNP